MPTAPDRHSTSVDYASTNVDRQDTFVEAIARRVRDRASEKSISSMALADAIEVKRSSMTNYWNGKRAYPVEALPRLAYRLDTNVDWLLTGSAGVARPSALLDAGTADWIEVPEYNLRNVTDESLGDPVRVAPIRRDWLNQTLRTSSDLWLAQLLSDYRSAGLEEGALVICRTIPRTELVEGNLCLWRIHESIAIGRFSIQPDAAVAKGVIGGLPGAQLAAGAIGSLRDRMMGFAAPELIVSPSQIGEDDGQYHLVGRIMGTFIRPL